MEVERRVDIRCGEDRKTMLAEETKTQKTSGVSRPVMASLFLYFLSMVWGRSDKFSARRRATIIIIIIVVIIVYYPDVPSGNQTWLAGKSPS